MTPAPEMLKPGSDHLEFGRTFDEEDWQWNAQDHCSNEIPMEGYNEKPDINSLELGCD